MDPYPAFAAAPSSPFGSVPLRASIRGKESTCPTGHNALLTMQGQWPADRRM
jgi:hypothetical protein